MFKRLAGSSLRASDRSLSGLNFSANDSLTTSTGKDVAAKFEVQARPQADEGDLDSSANFSHASPIAMASRSPMAASSPDSAKKPKPDAKKETAALDQINAESDKTGERHSGGGGRTCATDEMGNVGSQGVVESPVAAAKPTKRQLLDSALQGTYFSFIVLNVHRSLHLCKLY